MVVQGPDGERVVAADDFFVTNYTTAIGEGEVLTQVRLSNPPPSVWGFQEVARRRGDFAMAGVVFTADTDADGVIRSARLALFGVADRPIRAAAAETALVGTRIGDEAAAREAGALAPEGVDFASSIHVPGDYRRDICVAVVERAILDAVHTLGE
jgi:carbon-monoxide dehydrogenase medium subunit